MDKDSFLDTNIIFSYSNYNNQSKEIVKKCYFYIINKKSKFIVCEAVLDELEKIRKKRARIHIGVIKKIENPEYSLEESFLISKRDIPFAKKLYEKFKNYGLEKTSNFLRLDRRNSEVRIDKFLHTKVNERVIPLEQIDNTLVNKIHDIILNHADCKILASALQFQSTRAIFLFVTADEKDLDPNGYEYLKEHFEINYSNEKYKFPELLNLMFTN